MRANRYDPVDAPPPVALLNASLGPEMLKLNDRQRRFVDALLIKPDNYTAAAEAAGYKADNRNSLMVTAGRLAHDPRIISALKEEAQRRGQASVLLAMSSMVNLVADPTARDHFQATKFILGINGVGVTQEHRVTHDHKDDAAKMREIRQMAEFLKGQGVELDVEGMLGLKPEPKLIEEEEWVSK